MNKKWMALLLAAIMLLAAGCKKDGAAGETTEPTQPVQTETDPVIADEPISGVEVLDQPLNNPFEETGEAGQEAAENTGAPEDTVGNNGGSGAEKPDQSGDGAAAETGPAEPKPTESGTTEPEGGISYVSYEEYNNMTPAEQLAYYNQFPSMEAFVQWYNEAKAEYDREHGAIDVGDGDIDLGDIINP